MLYEITSVPTAQNVTVLLDPSDNVVIARVALASGQHIETAGMKLLTRDAIPAGHKVAIRHIAPGEPVHRYGHPIGFAMRSIQPGQHVHVHNLEFRDHDPSDTLRVECASRPKDLVNPATFLGYRRSDGRVGTRNYIAVVSASNCAAHTSDLIARSFADQTLPDNVDGVVAFPHGEGCGHTIGPDTQQLQRTLAGVLDHPNVSAALIIGLGCEVNQIDHYLGSSTRTSRTLPDTLQGLTLQGTGGTRGALDDARKHLKRFIDRAASEKRETVRASHIVLGLNCGGSDSFSGITANPALGHCCDLFVEQGGTIVLAETTEIFGAEHLLTTRARSPEAARKLLGCVEKYREYLRQFSGSSFNDNPSPGNKDGGLTTIVEKSLGAVAKSGTTPLEQVVDYGERIDGPGFVFMNTPGYDPVSLTGLAAGGVNLIAFTTGRGSAIGFPSVPVLKIASNSQTYRNMRDNMDVNAGTIADGEASIQEVGRDIFETLLRVASGQRTRAELLGHHEFVPWRIGPVL